MNIARSAWALLGALGLSVLTAPGFALAAQLESDAAAGAGSASAVPLTAHRLDDEQIFLDGRIVESAWNRALSITDFTQQEPVEGAEPTEPTEIKVAYDSDNLYIAAILYDDPEGIIAYQRERDAYLSTDDRFMWILDTFKDGRTGYFFETNANGMMGDAIMTGGGGGGGGGGRGGGGRAWDGIWEVRTARRDDGWSLEVRIPFRTLNFDPSADEWGINFQRTIRRKNEEILWRGWRRNEGLRRPVFAGTLSGLSGLSQGLGLEVVPSAIGSWKSIPGGGDPTSYPRDVSFDLNYSVTPSLRASLSINTDFAEVESDQRRVNLTRFPLRFPERRGFFLEGSGVFTFAPRSGPSPFFSRNIGLRHGQQVPIRFGTRATGQIGGTEVGFFQVGTGDLDYLSDEAPVHVDAEQFTVARLRQPFFEQSTIGGIYTRRDPGGEAGVVGHTAGVDLQLASRNFLGDNNAEMEAFVVWNSNPDASVSRSFGDLSARGLRVNFPNDIWSGHVSYREFGDDYDPTLGFVTRNNFRRIEPRIGWSPRPEAIGAIRNLGFDVQFRSLWGMGEGGVLEERQWEFGVVEFNLESGDNIDFEITNTYEFLDYSFDVNDGVSILPGEYDLWRYEIGARTASRRKVSLFGNLNWGEFWDGDRWGGFARVSVRPNPGVMVATNIQYNNVTLPRGSFTANVYELETDLNPSPWVAVSTQLQYDDVSQLVGLFARLRWIVKPGNDVYLVYTHNWQNLGTGVLNHRELTTLSRGASIKANYTYRF